MINANMVLPANLIEELQKYVRAGYIYIPARKGQRRSWGEKNGGREELDKWNVLIVEEYHEGAGLTTCP
ncbi:MAG: hypothetical protein KH366_12075 [Clostridiaceae bacterium]|nr:hypothetical protein [Clostridiaceae bacterium]